MSVNKIVTRTLLLLSAIAPLEAQIPRPQVALIDLEQPRGADLKDLYGRAASSRFVVVGTVTKHEGVGLRGSGPSMDADGILYTISVENIVCRQSDFDAGARSHPDDPLTLHLFVDWRPLTSGAESLTLGQRYLLFLFEPGREQQKAWTKTFDLSPKRVYYRGEELSRGVIPLAKPTAENPTPEEPPVLEKVAHLCEAVRPTNLANKLAGLRKLAESGDPVLSREAEAAAKVLQNKSK